MVFAGIIKLLEFPLIPNYLLSEIIAAFLYEAILVAFWLLAV